MEKRNWEFSAKELDMMTYWIDMNSGSKRGRTASIEEILAPWEEAKFSSNQISKIFKDSPILERTVSIAPSKNEIEAEIFGDGFHQFINDFYGKLMNKFGHYDNAYRYLENLVSANFIINNKYEGETFYVPVPNREKPLKISNGERIFRIYNKLFSAFGIDNSSLEKFRIAHSMAIGKTKVDATLCLSIHPMDYMTMSDNDCDWSSCMSWEDNGCYRQGTVEMMNSPCVIMVYTKTKENMTLGRGYEWNSKSWRTLLIVKDNLICNIKGYPYQHDEAVKLTINWVKELLGEEYTEPGVFTPFRENTLEDHTIEFTPSTRMMYNDFSGANKFHFLAYKPSWLKSLDTTAVKEYINYSGVCECMACGATNVEFADESSLCCVECDDVIFCDCCGRAIVRDSDNYSCVDDTILCEECYEEQTAIDAFSDEVHLIENMVEIRLMDDNNAYAKHYKIFSYGFSNEYFAEKASQYFSRMYQVPSGECYYVRISDLTDRGARLFDYRSVDELRNCVKADQKWYNPQPMFKDEEALKYEGTWYLFSDIFSCHTKYYDFKCQTQYYDFTAYQLNTRKLLNTRELEIFC